MPPCAAKPWPSVCLATNRRFPDLPQRAKVALVPRAALETFWAVKCSFHRSITTQGIIAMATQAANTVPVDSFHEQLKALLPRLRVYALSLTRDRDAADDLVHDTV